MTEKREVLCDACGTDPTYTQNTADYRLVLGAEGKTLHNPDLLVYGMAVENPMPAPRHFCDVRCLRDWLRERGEQ